MKDQSAFYPEAVVRRVRHNVTATAWGAASRDLVVAAAAPWLRYSDAQLWDAMFGHTITRSWMVWSNGHCPACQGQTPMYTWEIDALGRPWKVRCPHCAELFPKNDFHAFYLSGLDEHGVFAPASADRSLLHHAQHPDPADPLHNFGVDDGEGYVDGVQRWRFIGAYLVYGQWKQFVLGGINNLSAAYVVTGDPRYAHGAGVLLDRVADLYSSFDFQLEGLAYERSHSTGYVSTWHDACEESRQLAEAYDRVYPALRKDAGLVEFLAARARAHRLGNPKSTWPDIQRNLESGLLQEVLDNADKIHSNYPRQENALLVIQTVLDWPRNRDHVHELLDAMLGQAMAVDGVTGEKGLAGYATIGPHGVSQILGLFARLESGFLGEVYRRHPRLHELFRFHLDTRCLGRYYPHVGDSGKFTLPVDRYAGAIFGPQATLEPSAFSFMMDLYDLTEDAAFVQVLHEANGGHTAQLPLDLFAADPEAFQRKVDGIIQRHGTVPEVRSRNLEHWHIGILRSGAREQERAMWLHYDAGGRHSHRDGLNLGLFAHGMDVLPEFGYPPVQFGGWGSPRANWYKMTAGHNTVVVDGEDQQDGAGRTTLWADGRQIHAIRVAAPELYSIERYERTALLVDIDAEDSYVVDIFRVCGGRDHAKFVHSGFGQVETSGLELQPAADYGQGTQMRGFLGAEHAPDVWSADWTLEDRHGTLSAQNGAQETTCRGMRYIDLTAGAAAYRAEAWISLGYDAKNLGDWIPRLMIRRHGENPLSSTFVAVLAPHKGSVPVISARRLLLRDPAGKVCGDGHVAVEIALADGRRDLVIALDPEHAPDQATQKDWGLQMQGDLVWARSEPVPGKKQPRVTMMALVNGAWAQAPSMRVEASAQTALVEAQQ
jgi:oligo-alginate lyase